MIILGFQGTTLINYPRQISSIIFLGDCNLRCPYCYNKSLVYSNHNIQPLSKEYVLNEIRNRSSFNTGVCISGGEPTLCHVELTSLIHDIRAAAPGINIKLDTNGTRPEVLEHLLSEKEIDYVAMDFKTVPSEYKGTFCKNDVSDSILESMKVIRTYLDPEHYEFRTTVTRDLFTPDIAKGMARYLSKQDHIYFQNFKYFGEEYHINTKAFNDVNLASYTTEQLLKVIEPILRKCDNVYYRNF